MAEGDEDFCKLPTRSGFGEGRLGTGAGARGPARAGGGRRRGGVEKAKLSFKPLPIARVEKRKQSDIRGFTPQR
jgi:hypothetical protein